MPLSIGDKLGPYEILDQLGAGGMGVVYKARDTQLGRLVAIKILTPDKLTSAERKRRFVQEAKITAHLEHRCALLAGGVRMGGASHDGRGSVGHGGAAAGVAGRVGADPCAPVDRGDRRAT